MEAIVVPKRGRRGKLRELAAHLPVARFHSLVRDCPFPCEIFSLPMLFQSSHQQRDYEPRSSHTFPHSSRAPRSDPLRSALACPMVLRLHEFQFDSCGLVAGITIERIGIALPAHAHRRFLADCEIARRPTRKSREHPRMSGGPAFCVENRNVAPEHWSCLVVANLYPDGNSRRR